MLFFNLSCWVSDLVWNIALEQCIPVAFWTYCVKQPISIIRLQQNINLMKLIHQLRVTPNAFWQLIQSYCAHFNISFVCLIASIFTAFENTFLVKLGEWRRLRMWVLHTVLSPMSQLHGILGVPFVEGPYRTKPIQTQYQTIMCSCACHLPFSA